MRVTVYLLILVFICLNVSVYLVNEMEPLGQVGVQPYDSPTGIQGRLISLDLSGENLLIAGVTLGVGLILGQVLGNKLIYGTLAVVLFALDLIIPVVKWILFGFPIFLAQLDVPTPITTVLTTMMAVVWFWFLLGFIGQREIER